MKRRLRKKLHQGEFAPPVPQSGYQLIRREVLRQRTVKGYDEAHDDKHADGALERAADCYAQEPDQRGHLPDADELPAGWPWEAQYWKPSPNWRQRELVKAGALYEAEILRLDRREASILNRGTSDEPWQASLLRGIIASQETSSYDRVKAKQAAVETQLNEWLLARWLPTRPRNGELLFYPEAGPSDLAQVRYGLHRVLGGRRPQPWFFRWSAPTPGRPQLQLTLSEYPHCYDYQGTWQFDETGTLVSYQGAQQFPKL